MEAYGILESGRHWQVIIEAWMKEFGFVEIPDLSQLFIKKNSSGKVGHIAAKVVDDFLLAGTFADLKTFHKCIAKEFKVGRFTQEKTLMFDHLRVSQASKFSIYIYIEDYMNKKA